AAAASQRTPTSRAPSAHRPSRNPSTVSVRAASTTAASAAAAAAGRGCATESVSSSPKVSAGRTGTSHPGTSTSSTGINSTATNASVHTRWRVAAEARRSARAARPAAASNRAAFSAESVSRAAQGSARSRSNSSMSPALCAGHVDERGEALEFLGREFGRGLVEEGGHGLGGRAVEERPHHVAERRAAGLLGRHGGGVDVARAVLCVREVPLLFQDAEHGPDGRVARRVRKALHHLGGGGPFEAVDDVHDLPLAAAEVDRGHGRSGKVRPYGEG